MAKTHLSVRSDFSLGESTLKISDIVNRAKELGLESVALVDTMSVSGIVEFTNKAKKAGIKPIIGCTLRVYDDPTYRKPSKASGEEEKENRFYTLKVYIRSDRGLRSVFKMLSKANSEEYFYYHSRVGLKDVLELEGVIVTTGDFYSVLHHPDHITIIRLLSERFSTYIEIVPIHTPLFDTLNRRALDAHRACSGVPNVYITATYPALYLEDQHAESLDVLKAITGNAKVTDPWFPVQYVRDFSLSDSNILTSRIEAFANRISVNTENLISVFEVANKSIVSACEYEFKKHSPCLPKMANDEFAKLIEEVKKGWVVRFSKPVLGHKPSDEELPAYKARLAYEMSVLKNMGFAGYFLLVQDIVQWSKLNGISVGPGRGSSSGSLVAYLLGITDADPIRFNLLFERFINPSRIDLPDADLDFMSTRRHEVIEYITKKYGADKVAGISNYSTLGPSSAIRDVSRVHGLEPYEYSCSKQVEKEHGVSLSLTESVDRVPDIAKFKDKYPKIWSHAVTLEGAMRNLGQHAAGIVIADEPITNRAVVETRKGSAVVAWDKRTTEDWGLIKMDILGLSTLDLLNKALDYIEDRHSKRINLLELPLDDKKTLDAFGRGESTAVFQFESNGMRSILKRLAEIEPLTFEDVAVTTAIYRPGPIDAGFVDQYIDVKQGKRAPYYEHPAMENSLKNTCGVMVYQEQVMQICQDVAGFNLVDADHVRRAMGKKDAEKMAEWEIKFVEGAVKSGMDESSAQMLWGKIAGFAQYGFNKSHAIAYTILSYFSMYLKVHYSAEFFAAAMTVIDNEEKLPQIVIDARKHGMKVLPPDINKSSDRIEIEGEDTLYMPFQAIKGISTNVAEKIVSVQKAHGKPFASKEEFEKVATQTVAGKINVKHKSGLDRVGAFASIEQGQFPSTHPSRLKDHLELMPGFTVDSVKADRNISVDKHTLQKVMSVCEEFRGCDKCSLKGATHPNPRIGKSAKFMVVFDSPTFDEAKAGKMLEGEGASYFKAALKDAGLSSSMGYYTSLVKAPKPAGVKVMPNEAIMACSDYLAQEIEILKPPVIVAMGSNAIRYFAPEVKGPPSDLVGKVIFDPKLDASIVFGINPTQIVFDASKVGLLQTVCGTIAELVN